jgi:diguanylate cyclase (GGDEF)-like protein/PAS domain S-box-containing protein
LEIEGINKIANIHNLDLLLKSIRGISQLNDKDQEYIKKNLYISSENILQTIREIGDKAIEKSYENIIKNKKSFSKMQLFKEYTNLLVLLKNKRVELADKHHLLFETDRDIYFLVTIAISNIPDMIENIGKIRGIGVSILSNKTHGEEKFLLKNNIYIFTQSINQIKYTISKFSSKDADTLNNLLTQIISDFYDIKIDVRNLERDSCMLSAKEYFIKNSILINNINKLFLSSKSMITDRLQERKNNLNNKLLEIISFYILLFTITVLALYFNHMKIYKDEKIAKIKKEEDNFISKLQDDFTKQESLKYICNISLTSTINYFKAVNGSLYLFDAENDKLYLGSTYGLKDDALKQTLDLHENLISENILEKEIHISDVNEKVNLGNIDVLCTKLITIPITEFNKSIGTIQLLFDEQFNKIDMNFLKDVISLMGTYIYKAQNDDVSLSYLKLIDKNVLISKTDLDGNITEISEQLCKLSQYSKDELIGQNHRIFRHPDTKKDVFADMWKTIKNGQTWRGETKNRTKSGSFYWVYSVITPNFDINGNIIGYTAIRTDITDKKIIEQIAITDGLTSLYNRRHFDDIFSRQIKIAKRDKQLLTFIMIDIDYFKQYNDIYGHQAGDETLIKVAKQLKLSLKRPSDYAFRLGGEEFGALFNTSQKEDAIIMADNIRKSIENLQIPHSANTASKYVTISIGINVIDYKNSEDVNKIYKDTDEALYIAKKSGRNQVSIVKD